MFTNSVCNKIKIFGLFLNKIKINQKASINIKFFLESNILLIISSFKWLKVRKIGEKFIIKTFKRLPKML